MRLSALGVVIWIGFTMPLATPSEEPASYPALATCTTSSPSECPKKEARRNDSGSAVDVTEWIKSWEGSPPSDSASDGNDGGGSGAPSDSTYTAAPKPVPIEFFAPGGPCFDTMSPIQCLFPTTGDPADPDAPAFVPPTVYAADLARFFPNTPSIVGEPAGAGLIGKTANIVASTDTHIINGSLFDHPVAVVFAPTNYVFDYGDGSSITSDTGGETWADTGAPQYSATPTGHAYEKRGEYTATVSVNYAASVNFGDGVWRGVIGTVAASSTYDLRVYQPKSALVNNTCLEKPDGIGC